MLTNNLISRHHLWIQITITVWTESPLLIISLLIISLVHKSGILWLSLLIPLILDVVQVVIIKDYFLNLFLWQYCGIVLCIFHFFSTCLNYVLHQHVLLVDWHLFLKHEEVHHLVEHGQTVFGWKTRTLSSFSHLISRLFCIYFKRLDSFTEITNFFINTRQITSECLLKDFKGLLLAQLFLDYPMLKLINTQFE